MYDDKKALSGEILVTITDHALIVTHLPTNLSTVVELKNHAPLDIALELIIEELEKMRSNVINIRERILSKKL